MADEHKPGRAMGVIHEGVDLEAVASRWQLARMAGEDADYNGWDEAKINAMVRSWQDLGILYRELMRYRDVA